MDLTKRQIIVSLIGLVLLIGLGLKVRSSLAASKKDQEKKPSLESVSSVRVAPVAYSDHETEMEYYGRVSPLRTAEIIAEVQGRILPGANLKAGRRINKGQLICRIDDREASLNLQSQKSQFLKSLADILADLKIDYPERYPVWQSYFESIAPEKDMPALPEIKDLKEKTFLASRGIIAAYYGILSQEERLKKYRIYAPLSGSISSVTLEEGSVVNPGSRILTLQQTDQLELVLPVLATDLDHIQTGTEVLVSSENGERQWKGTVARVGDLVASATQSVDVYVTVSPEKDKPLYAGQYLRATIPGKVVRKAMDVPRRALVDKNFVFTVEGNRLQKREVVVHRIGNGSALISGLAVGDTVVTEIPLNAVEAMRIKPIGASK